MHTLQHCDDTKVPISNSSKVHSFLPCTPGEISGSKQVKGKDPPVWVPSKQKIAYYSTTFRQLHSLQLPTAAVQTLQ
jgi:hypothetical protein